ncbi:FUSC family protein [Nocardia stercoris]|uniref:FUSC family protein n=1 Tax=Nocardia stercoris TaxID=2483361 RepID=A0A3M2KYI0_9NOCA|nr:FUSC family protein [Nocardia stercoris]RMI28595.1 FUSC family protein [Nocardia stercoris]
MLGRAIGSLFTVGPRADDRQHALRVAAGLAVPGVILVAVGRPDLLLYAVFGSFTGMYGRIDDRRTRLRHQCEAAAFLITGVTVGVILAATGVTSVRLVVVETVFAAVGSVFADSRQLLPRGPFFALFALGACAMVPAGAVWPGVAVAICAATAVWAIVIGRLDTRTRHRTHVDADRQVTPVLNAIRYPLAVGLAGACGVALGVAHANWAMISAAVPLAARAADTGYSVQRAVHRIVGTYAGLVATALLLLPHPQPRTLAIVVMVLIFPTEQFMARNYALAMGFFTPLIMLMTDLASPTAPRELVVDRGLDTMIGVGIGVAVLLLVRPRADPS